MLLLLAIAVLIIAGAMGAWFYALKADEKKMLAFLVEHPDRSAIYWCRNDTLMVGRAEDRIMPLASTLKIVVAIEFAMQVANGELDPDQQIDTAALGLYYLPNTDGGAHEAWLQSDTLSGGQRSIKQIAQGMITYSSNANTEWLMDRLGMERLQHRLELLGVTRHTPFFYIASSLFVPQLAFPGWGGDSLATAFSAMDTASYYRWTRSIHDDMKAGNIDKSTLAEWGEPLEKAWSDRLTASTVKEYAGIVSKINGRDYFPPRAQALLEEVMERLMENPRNRAWLEHAGQKGGSTMFVLTKALYATDKKGVKTELVYFLDNLDFWEQMRLSRSMNAFELHLLTDATFAEKVRGDLAGAR